jgi:hypothetical protein
MRSPTVCVRSATGSLSDDPVTGGACQVPGGTRHQMSPCTSAARIVIHQVATIPRARHPRIESHCRLSWCGNTYSSCSSVKISNHFSQSYKTEVIKCIRSAALQGVKSFLRSR